ncbi:hypothetical protein AAVH_10522 [Aphelenchoides avenae]|nr:hypothetical protein AAVH_10522 [Aphelenchus avenae]
MEPIASTSTRQFSGLIFGGPTVPSAHLAFCRPVAGGEASSAPLTLRGIADSSMPVGSLPGILHRLDNIQLCTQADICSPAGMCRCPGCRRVSELMCPSCMSVELRLGKVRDAYRVQLLTKAELARSIGEHLRDRMNFEYDYHQKQRSITELKAKIAAKKERNARLRQRIEGITVGIGKSKKNLALLENKANVHQKRIAETQAGNEQRRQKLIVRQTELTKFNSASALRVIHQIFPMQRVLRKSSTKNVWQQKLDDRNERVVYKIRAASVRDSNYHLLESELCTGSSIVLSSRTRGPFTALSYSCQMMEVLSAILNVHLPYRISLRQFATHSAWTQDLFATEIFKVNTCAMALCLSQGVPASSLVFKRPFANLNELISLLSNNPNARRPSELSEKQRREIDDELNKLRWEDSRQQHFNLDVDNVEEDWEKVDITER